MDRNLPFNIDLPLKNMPALPNCLPASSLKAKQTQNSEPKPVDAPPPAPSPSTPLRSKAEAARARGRAMGGGFATLNTPAAMERAENMDSAMRLGFTNAARQEDREAFISQDADSLRELGFHGRADDDL